MKIILLRHGEPEYALTTPKNLKLTPAELPELIANYTGSPLNPDCLPSDTTRQLVADCRTVVCSDLRRSIESARFLGFNQPHYIDALFRESDLPYANWRFPRLSIYSWLITFRLMWFFGYANNGEPIKRARQRAQQAAHKLISLANENGPVLLVGHGFINRFIASQLREMGWYGPKDPGRHFWEYGIYHATPNHR